MRFVCPKLKVWVGYHRRANRIWKKAGSPGTPPPIPPTMDMWASLADDDKEDEWALMLAWLTGHDAEEVADFPDCDWYVTGAEYIEELCIFRHSPYGRDPLLSEGRESRSFCQIYCFACSTHPYFISRHCCICSAIQNIFPAIPI